LGRAQDGISLLARRYRISTKKSYNASTESLNAWDGRDVKSSNLLPWSGLPPAGIRVDPFQPNPSHNTIL